MGGLTPFLETRTGCGQVGWIHWLENNCENSKKITTTTKNKRTQKHPNHFILSVSLSQRTMKPQAGEFGDFTAEQTTGAHCPITHTIMVVDVLKVGTCYNIHFEKLLGLLLVLFSLQQENQGTTKFHKFFRMNYWPGFRVTFVMLELSGTNALPGSKTKKSNSCSCRFGVGIVHGPLGSERLEISSTHSIKRKMTLIQ